MTSPPRKHDLRALVVVANPDLSNVSPGGRNLAPIDPDKEMDRAQALTDIQVEILPDGHHRATMPAIHEVLASDQSEHGIDVLYMVCHGAFLEDESVLYLENADGTYDGVKGSRIAEMIGGLSHRPTLAVICACRSAGGDDAASDEVRGCKALGPLLAKAGIPAVLAMQGDFTMESAARFMPAFFGALRRDGVIDRAVAHARSQIADRSDWWMPVLFSRLRTGRTYYVPEFSDESTATWQALIDGIETGLFTPVIVLAWPTSSGFPFGDRSTMGRAMAGANKSAHPD